MAAKTLKFAKGLEDDPTALPVHSETAPFKRSEGRNLAFRILQDAGRKGLTKKEWTERMEEEMKKAGLKGSPVFYTSFVARAKRRVVIGRKEMKSGADRLFVISPAKPRTRKKKVKVEENAEAAE